MSLKLEIQKMVPADIEFSRKRTYNEKCIEIIVRPVVKYKFHRTLQIVPTYNSLFLSSNHW